MPALASGQCNHIILIAFFFYFLIQVFQNFCQKLLCELLCTHTHFKKQYNKLEVEDNKHEDIITRIEDILHVVLCQK